MNNENNNPFNNGGVPNSKPIPPMGTIEVNNSNVVPNNQVRSNVPNEMVRLSSASEVNPSVPPKPGVDPMMQQLEPVSFNSEPRVEIGVESNPFSQPSSEVPPMFNQPEDGNDKKDKLRKKKKVNKPMIIIISIVGVLIALTLVFVFVISPKLSNKTKDNETVTKVKTYQYSGFEFTQLTGYKYTTKDNILVITNNKTKESFFLKVLAQPFDQISDEVFAKSLTDTGYQVTDIKKIIYNSNQLLISEMASGNQSAFAFALPSTNKNYSFYGVSFNKKYTNDYKLISDLMALMTDVKAKSKISLSTDQLLMNFDIFKNNTSVTTNTEETQVLENNQNTQVNQTTPNSIEEEIDDDGEEIIEEDIDSEDDETIDEEY